MLPAATIVALSLVTFDESTDDAKPAASEHPVVAAVRQSLETDGGRTDRAFTLVVSMEAGEPDKLIAAFTAPLVETRKEEGNLQYILNQDADNPKSFLLVERWKSLDDLAEHLEQPYLVQLLKDLDELATIELQVLRTVGRRGKRAKKSP